VRAFVLPPFFWLLSMAEPAVKLGHNTGILHVYTRAIGTQSQYAIHCTGINRKLSHVLICIGSPI
jgi:hypothetical protein